MKVNVYLVLVVGYLFEGSGEVVLIGFFISVWVFWVFRGDFIR